MRFSKRALNQALSIVLGTSLAVFPTLVLCGGSVGGATEYTQVLNNIELMASVTKQAAIVEQEIISNINLVKHYATMMQNLKTMDPVALARSLAGYQNQIAAFNSIQGSVSSLKNAAQSAYAMVQGRSGEASALGMDINTYLKNEIALAKTRGGAYQQRLAQDTATIQNLADRSANLQQVSAATAQVSGNVQGLQNLAQLSSIAAGELMEIKAALVTQSADKNAQAALQAQIDANNAALAAQAAAQAKARKERNTNTRMGATAPWTGN